MTHMNVDPSHLGGFLPPSSRGVNPGDQRNTTAAVRTSNLIQAYISRASCQTVCQSTKQLIHERLSSYAYFVWQLCTTCVHTPNATTWTFEHSSIGITPFWHDIHHAILCCLTKYFRLCKHADTPFWHHVLHICLWNVRFWKMLMCFM
jgi:hypothetical protein